MGILDDTCKFSVAMDRSCLNSGASHHGVKICKCKSNGIYYYKCHRRYSGPNATTDGPAIMSSLFIHLDAWVKHAWFSIIDPLDKNSGIAARFLTT